MALDVHVFRTPNGRYAAFDPDSRALFAVSPALSNLLQGVSTGGEPKAGARGCPLEEQAGEAALASYREATAKVRATRQGIRATDRKVCTKLTLLLTNTCNMRCTYCFADGGSYHQARSMMDACMVKRTLDTFHRQFSAVKHIMLFGGEPLLNVRALEAVCEYYRDWATEDRPALGVVTNLTILPEPFIRLVKERHISVTASLDGPELVNDCQRVFANGSGSYRVVANNIQRLQSLTGQPSMIEATLTRAHGQHGLTVGTLARFFSEMFGIRRVEIAEAVVPEGHPARLEANTENTYADGYDELLNSLIDGSESPVLNQLCSILTLLLNRAPSFDYHCFAGVESYAVAPDGGIYPCHIFVGKPDYLMGNVQDDEPFTSSQMERVRRPLVGAAKSQDPKCRDCWARNLCIGCLGRSLVERGTVRVSVGRDCQPAKAIIQSILGMLVDLYDSPKGWQRLLDYVGGMRECPVSTELERSH